MNSLPNSQLGHADITSLTKLKFDRPTLPLSVEESIRMTEDRDKWRKYVHGVANPRIEEG